jgi:hypothetical protein
MEKKAEGELNENRGQDLFVGIGSSGPPFRNTCLLLFLLCLEGVPPFFPIISEGRAKMEP